MDENALKERSRALLDAFDRGDGQLVAGALSLAFVHFEGGNPTGRDKLLEGLAKRKPGAPHVAERVWSEEHVSLSPGVAVFIGKAHERASGNDVHGARLSKACTHWFGSKKPAPTSCACGNGRSPA